jgi:hypothetical protein
MSARRKSSGGSKKSTPQKKTADAHPKNSTDPEQIAFWDSVSTILKSNLDDMYV